MIYPATTLAISAHAAATAADAVARLTRGSRTPEALRLRRVALMTRRDADFLWEGLAYVLAGPRWMREAV